MKTKIIYFISPTGNNYIKKFIVSLQISQRVKVMRVFKLISEYGLSSIIPHTRKLKATPIWEVRILGKHNIRIFYGVPYKDTVLILHGFIKKSMKTPQKEINKALKRYHYWLDK